jgi:predicted alpha/beta hydrolase family esterase
MKNAIIIHGTCSKKEYFDDKYPSLSNSHWLPWLQKQLLIKGIFTQTPEMLNAYGSEYKYKEWVKQFECFDINEETILIGHSSGGGFLIRWLSENKIKIKKLILVAPWIDPEKEEGTNFFDFEIDKHIPKRIEETHLFVSSDDDKDILDSVKIIEKNIPNIKFHKFSNLGHFTFDRMHTDSFPELLNTVID